MVYSYPEAARERDLHKYYRPWLDAQSLERTEGGIGIKGLSGDGYTPQSSRDRALTAFAQLAALRLDTRRCMVSLIDSSRQYILAEATRTVSLLTANAERPEDEVWLGTAILNRADAVCYHTFSSSYTAKECDGRDYKTECMVIPDCRLDPRFTDRDYVKEGSVRFYAGVPIITRAGHRIGVYAVSDDKPRAGLSAAEVRFMEDVSAAVMEHLELAKHSLDRIKGERMVRGLTQFIERSSVHDSAEPQSRATTMERQTENARLETLDEDDANKPAVTTPALAVKPSQRKRGEGSDTARLFQRAARIIRQSTDADGVVFFDTSAAGISAMLALHEMRSPPVSSDESATQNNTTDFDTGDSTASRRQRRRKKVSFVEPPTESVSVESTPCPVAALSLRPGNAALVHADFRFTDTAMERYIHRYPLGKFFNYNEEGLGINSSDERSQTSETEQSDRTETETSPKFGPKKPRKKRDQFYPSEFLKVLPNVRTLIFLPLWDHSSERWIAGGFIWTTQAGRLMSPEHELPYLQAFGNSVISEVARLNAQKADKAKTTFIASISHELRSPLHGILGSVELLRETAASAYQDSLVSSIDVSGRVLLDTIDHVLDYAKINKLRSANPRKKQQRGDGRAKRMPADNSILGVTADFDLALLVEEVCDTVCAGHTFRKTQNHNGGAIYDQAENKEDKNNNGDVPKAGRDTHGSVMVSLIVAPFVSWVVRSQPGALRRIVMNLIGNSLKYTDSGHIAITLTQNNSDSNALDLILLVEDSGRGMSQEYLRTKLFSPFSQEDPFSSGTGLGLSIVKQIVESLNGDIEVDSTVAVGTQVKVRMRLPCGQLQEAKRDSVLLDAPDSLRNTSVCILTEPDTQGGVRSIRTKESIHKACQNFDMDISTHIDADTNNHIPDVDFLVTDSTSLDQLLLKPSSDQVNSKPTSLVCVCTDVSEKTALENRVGRQIEALGWISEFVTQPCGPRKLAHVMLSALRRASKESAQRQSLGRSATAQSPDHLQPQPALPHRSVSDSFATDPATTESTNETIVPLTAHTPSSVIHHPASITTTATSSPKTTTMTVPRLTPSSENQPQEYFTPTVLLVDDNAINLKLLVVFAKRQNLRYAEATNGLEAFNKYKQDALAATNGNDEKPVRPFDFVLMDLSMPVMGGLESTRQIRQFEKKMGLGRCCIVALTGLASAQDQQDAQDAGVDMYLVKPVKFADIKRVFGAN